LPRDHTVAGNTSTGAQGRPPTSAAPRPPLNASAVV